MAGFCASPRQQSTIIHGAFDRNVKEVEVQGIHVHVGLVHRGIAIDSANDWGLVFFLGFVVIEPMILWGIRHSITQQDYDEKIREELQLQTNRTPDPSKINGHLGASTRVASLKEEEGLDGLNNGEERYNEEWRTIRKPDEGKTNSLSVTSTCVGSLEEEGLDDLKSWVVGKAECPPKAHIKEGLTLRDE
ncbi:hypothetical protein J3R30DRAFT_3414436 [Lentinula aciculospora]|uniref:Uncharacterized protein n=1 Tax=Lentinula aciculospora TaxID=153920 RepID=A0A9W8ZRW7_9AGAR|nr:hypothetical protein J3R30DRAFT_3414436 [Lentinula aciculospora]